MAVAKRELPTPPLYESDYYTWALEQAALLRGRRFGELDLENLIDEVDALARGEARELRSRYEMLLLHLLKWEFQPEKRSNSWAATVVRERGDVVEHLDENPGLKPRRQELFGKAYRGARAGAAAETNLPVEHFPAENPYALEQVLDEDYWPGGREMPARETRGRHRR